MGLDRWNRYANVGYRIDRELGRSSAQLLSGNVEIQEVVEQFKVAERPTDR